MQNRKLLLILREVNNVAKLSRNLTRVNTGFGQKRYVIC